MSMMWGKLLNDTRIRNLNDKSAYKPNKGNNIFDDHRNEFERDYDRINNSSAVRRLQDKAQVYPLQSNDFIRTRLTHSMEVSSIARSLGNFLERYLIENEKIDFSEIHQGKIPSLLASAALVHDIGNPPFGHYGEDVIKAWFANEKNKERVREWIFECLGNEEDANNQFSLIISDYQSFDGNAQGLRVLNNLQYFKDDFGLNLTVGTLSSLLKYPFDSSHAFAKEKQKFGYFSSDKLLIESIKRETLGDLECTFRNPLTFLLEAADDIAYIGSDLEDGVKKGSIIWDKEFRHFVQSITQGENILAYVKGEYEDIEILLNENELDSLKKIELDHEKFIQEKHPDPMVASARSFKVWSQAILISEVKKVFDENYEKIMNGEFGDFSILKNPLNDGKKEFNHRELIDCSPKASALRKWMNGLLSQYCFVDSEVITLELVGDRVINDLLDVFLLECMFKITNEETFKNKKVTKLYSLISDNIKFINVGDKEIYEVSPYKKVQIVIDFISGMTDSYALDLHQKLSGVKMP
ncbi:dGTP triphosphohydrolase [Exiguobacterium sp. s63]|uniref:dGTP triphosphohydrolase n=1 Tax=Exiguobacterium sp. s63 TaxID=2751274 RepID=UPI001BEBE614|nr:dNTP triphosphohydrolase [Exiguobacterium sp. s63]